MSEQPIRVLVVEDSPVMRMLLVHILESDPRIELAGEADSGYAALEALAARSVDVVLMDIHMEGMDGFETARKIMETRPVPIVMCSAVSDPHSVATSFQAYEVGALAVVAKPVSVVHPDFKRQADELLQSIRLMSEVKVVRRWPKRSAHPVVEVPPKASEGGRRVDLVGIGASTGGPPALQTLLAALPADFPVPLLVVQHITAGFLTGLVEWLDETTCLTTCIAKDGVTPRPGCVYFAPDDHHLTIASDGRLRLDRQPAENSVRPSADRLFHSLAEKTGPRAVGVLLTGMGKDGAQGLRAMRERGAATIAQDRETSVVFGMPGAAVALCAAEQVLPIDRIGEALCRLVYSGTRSRTNA